MKETGGTGGHTASAESSAAINSLGSGAPLSASERSFFEPRFGQDLSHIRVHTGGTADTAARSINARAFSLGNNIAFANGEYQPGTHSGRTLMAHEITHTLQGGTGINRVVRRVAIPVYGNWCGPGHGGGAEIDDIDEACHIHDNCYDARGYFNCACDGELLVNIVNALSTGVVASSSGNRMARAMFAYFSASPCVTYLWGVPIPHFGPDAIAIKHLELLSKGMQNVDPGAGSGA